MFNKNDFQIRTFYKNISYMDKIVLCFILLDISQYKDTGSQWNRSLHSAAELRYKNTDGTLDVKPYF